MKIHYIVLSLALLAASACTVEPQQVESVDSQVTIKAYQEGAVESKTAVVDGGSQVFWEPGDAINVFFKGTGSKFVSLNTELASVADFSGYFSGLVGANEGAGSGNCIWGLYPYRADAVSDGQSVTTTLPDIQTAREGSFARNTHISLACAHNLDLAFYNVCGGLRFSLTQEGIKSITFEGNDGEILTGRIKLAFEGGVPTIQEITEGKTSITLKAPSGTPFQTGQWYYIAALPGSLTKGFKMTFERESDSAKLTSSSNVSFKRGKYGSLADADEDLVFKSQGGNDNPGGETPEGEIISFADEKIKAKLVAAFDTNGDGELSYEEAAAVTSIESVFGAIKTYKSFDEFQYFTGVTAIPNGMFKEWNLLSSILLPNSIKEIGYNAFEKCINLSSIIIPLGVTSINDNAFLDCSGISTIVIPESVISLGSYAFYGCSNLTSVTIPFGTLKGSFERTLLKSIVINGNVTSIDDFGFNGCTSLSSIVIPESVTSIGGSAFYGCTSLSSIVIAESVTSIGSYAFYGCTNLLSINLPQGLTSVSGFTFYGCSSLKSIVIPNGVTSIGNYAFNGCTNLASIVIPDSVTSIGADYSGDYGNSSGGTFYGCSSLTSIVIPERVTLIADYTFAYCTSLISIDLPESLKHIGNSAFNGCTSLASIAIPKNVTSLGGSVFQSCSSLTSVALPDGISTIWGQSFYGCSNLSSINVPESVTTIYARAFYECSSLTDIHIPESVTSIGEEAFRRCSSLSSIDIPESVSSIENGLLRGCSSLTTIVVPESVTSIGDYAFSGCTSAATIVIPNSVTSIRDGAFYGCTSLSSIVIPESVTSIGWNAFAGCTVMTSCKVLANTPPLLEYHAFDNNNCNIYVPSGSVETYKSANGWSNYSSRIFAITE